MKANSILDGIRVLDLSTAMAGPYCATFLADLGADVIKLEKPRRGDLTRFSDHHVSGESGYFLGINRGKRGLTTDLRKPEGQEIVRRLIPTTDVLIENYRQGKMDEWNLGYKEISAIRKDIIYCSVSAYGDAANYEQAIGNDLTCQGYSGLMDLTGEPDGTPERVGAPVIDAAGSMLSTIGVLAALMRRNALGIGEHLCVSLLEAAYAMMPNYITTLLNTDHEFHRMGTGHPQFVPYRAFACSDGSYVILGSFHNASWVALCKSIGCPGLLEDPRFRENDDRTEHRDELHEIIGAEIAKRTQQEWVDIFSKVDMPCAPILSIRDSVELFGNAIPGFKMEVTHGALGKVTMPRPPIRFVEHPLERAKGGAPTLGESTAEILAEAGYSTAQVRELQANRIV